MNPPHQNPPKTESHPQQTPLKPTQNQTHSKNPTQTHRNPATTMVTQTPQPPLPSIGTQHHHHRYLAITMVPPWHHDLHASTTKSDLHASIAVVSMPICERGRKLEMVSGLKKREQKEREKRKREKDNEIMGGERRQIKH